MADQSRTRDARRRFLFISSGRSEPATRKMENRTDAVRDLDVENYSAKMGTNRREPAASFHHVI